VWAFLLFFLPDADAVGEVDDDAAASVAAAAAAAAAGALASSAEATGVVLAVAVGSADILRGEGRDDNNDGDEGCCDEGCEERA